jgi:hypothetical protein
LLRKKSPHLPLLKSVSHLEVFPEMAPSLSVATGTWLFPHLTRIKKGKEDSF